MSAESATMGFEQAKRLADKYREHLLTKDFLTEDQMALGYEDSLNQPFIVEVVPAPADDKISIECVKSFLNLNGKSWDTILKEISYDKNEYIVLIIATNQNRNEYANELNQFLVDHPHWVIK
ncbi:MAG TPA: hypothetical protein VGN00_20325 [Puia sp.]|jgi:hypothetical protein